MRLCIDMGSNHIKGGLFEGGRCVKVFGIKEPAELKNHLGGFSIEQGLLVCSDPLKGEAWAKEITASGIPMKPVLCDNFSERTTPELKDLLLPDTIAKIYGALSICPTNDCLVVDFGTTVRYELISRQGKLLGRTTFPFFELLFHSLSTTPSYLNDEIPEPLGKNPIESVSSGCYYGLLGSVERIIAEIRLEAESPSEIITIATGTLTENPSWKNPLSELVDHIHPYLILEGLNQMLQEESNSSSTRDGMQ